MVGERENAGSFGFLGLTGGRIFVQEWDLEAAPAGLDAGDIGKVYKVAAVPTAEDEWDTAGAGGMLARWSEDLAWQYLDPAQTRSAAMIECVVAATSTVLPGEILVYHPGEAEWFAPYGSMGTTEVWTGTYTANGSKRYRKGIDIGALPNATTKDVAHGVTGMVLSVTGTAYLDAPHIAGWYTNATDAFSLGHVLPGVTVGAKLNATNLTITTSADVSTYKGFAVIEYCKAP